MPGRKRDARKSPDLEQPRGDTRYREQARQVSESLPNPPDDDPGGPALGGGQPRPFSETDAEERSDTPRRVGEIPRGTGAAPEQAEFDEDGGGPRQSVLPTEGGPEARETQTPDDQTLRAETGGMGGFDRSAEDATPDAMTEGTAAGARTRGAAAKRPHPAKGVSATNRSAGAAGRATAGAKKGRNQAAKGGGKKSASGGAKNKTGGRKGGKATGRGR